MYPILARYGPFFLYSYTVVLAVGIAAGIGLAFWRRRGRQGSLAWLDGLLVGLVAGLIGGRAGFVWLEWAYFVERPSQILQFPQGGLNYHSALLAGLLAWWGWTVWRKRPFIPDADLLAPSFALVSAFGWLACWLEGCGYGRAAPSGHWLAADLPDTFGVYAWRYQTQLLGIGLSLLVFLWALRRQRHWPPGRALWFVIFALSLGRVGVNMLRGDPAIEIAARQIGSLRADIILDSAFAILSLILLKYNAHKIITYTKDNETNLHET